MKKLTRILALAGALSTSAFAQRPPSAPPPPGCQCATGHWYDPNVKSCVTTACEIVTGMPDGDKGGGFFAWSGHLFVKTACSNVSNSCLNGPAGTICTFAGNGAAGTSPDGTPVATNPITPGILHYHSKFNAILFTENNKIRGVNPNNGTFYTLAGSGNPGYQDGPAQTAKMQDISGLWSHPTQPWVYFSQHNFYGLLRGVNFVGNTVTTSLIAGDPAVGNQSIDGPATAGAKLWWPRDVTLSASGVLYFVEHFSKKLRRIDNSNSVVTLCTFPGVTNITGFALGSGNDVFLVDGAGNRVVRSSLSCAAPVNVSPVGTGLTSPMIFDASKDRLVLKRGANQVVEIKGVSSNSTLSAPNVVAGSGAFGNGGDTGPGPAAQLKGVNGLAIGPAGHLYISTGDKIRVLKQ